MYPTYADQVKYIIFGATELQKYVLAWGSPLFDICSVKSGGIVFYKHIF